MGGWLGRDEFYIAPSSLSFAIILSTSSTLPPPFLGGGSGCGDWLAGTLSRGGGGREEVGLIGLDEMRCYDSGRTERCIHE